MELLILRAKRQVALFEPLCAAQLAFLQMASGHAKPNANGLGPLLKPQADAITAIMETKDKLNRSKEGREWGACLSTIGEGVGAWGWVQVVSRCITPGVNAVLTLQEPTPAPYVTEMKNAAQFWADRVLKQFKETYVFRAPCTVHRSKYTVLIGQKPDCHRLVEIVYGAA